MGEPILNAFRFQRDVAPTSPLYGRLLGAVVDDAMRGGVCADVLEHTPPDVEPVLDALPLRLMGGVHRLVLDGDAPELAAYYPSVGGRFDPDEPASDPTEAFLATIATYRDAMIASLSRAVQTNEVGRCASLLPGFLEVASTTGLPLRVLEVGTSAGLNLRWDHYRYEGGADSTAFGDPQSSLRFAGVYDDPLPRLDASAVVVERRGCDRSPIDAGSAEGSQLLRSFVWADQVERFAALDAALAIAKSSPVEIDRADAHAWVDDQLRDRREGRATVIFHSIVWQYLAPETRAGIKDSIHAAGARASSRAPIAWLRMEPGTDPAAGAEVRLTMWPGGAERIVARTGYHGRPVRLCK
ncbi:MAG TPA: DUF2332 domain-containing protein [Acidimicrobiales bacterium]|nr:DUF2332 domain-containing protein [Acidimicrobiales bacterium]